MGRTIVGVVVGFIAMVMTVFVSLSIAYLAMGAERAFQPRSFEVTGAWLAVMLVVNIVAALVGGFVCAAIAPSPKAPVALAVVVLVLGLLSAIPAFLPPPADAPTVRDGSLDNFAAMQSARQPVWVALVTPLIGAGGAIAGAKLRNRPASALVAAALLAGATINHGFAWAQDSVAPAVASLDDLRFIAGAWKGEMNGDLVEEHWTEPAGDAILGMFRWAGKDGKTRLFEILSIKADADGPTLRLRHFDGSLSPWKSEAESIPSLRLSEHAADRAVFANSEPSGGLKSIEYRVRDRRELHITVSFQNSAREPLQFHLKRTAR